jgi:hypothetical protein
MAKQTLTPPPESTPDPKPAPLQLGVDYYLENGRYVFTADFLQRRGYCCGSGCRHCPYPKSADAATKKSD